MQLDLAHIAIATGGTLVTAAGKKKATKPSNLQHHTTFGIKKPKAAKLTKQKVSVPVRKPIVTDETKLEKFADKLKGYFERTTNLDWVYTFRKTSGFIRVTTSADYATFDVRSSVFPGGINFNTKYFEIKKITSKQVEEFARFVQALGKIEMPKTPRFLAK